MKRGLARAGFHHDVQAPLRQSSHVAGNESDALFTGEIFFDDRCDHEWFC